MISPPVLAVGLVRRGRAGCDPPQAGARLPAYSGCDIAVGDGVISPPALAAGLLRAVLRLRSASAGTSGDGGVLRP